jgi:uncharacterized membrane protein
MEQQIASTDQEIARLIVFNAMVQSQIGEITKISDEVTKKYDSIQTTTLAPLTVVLGGGLAFYLGDRVARKFQSILEPLTIVVKVVASAAVAMEALVQSQTTTKVNTDVLRLVDNVQMTAALMALLEEAQKSGKSKTLSWQRKPIAFWVPLNEI